MNLYEKFIKWAAKRFGTHEELNTNAFNYFGESGDDDYSHEVISFPSLTPAQTVFELREAYEAGYKQAMGDLENGQGKS